MIDTIALIVSIVGFATGVTWLLSNKFAALQREIAELKDRVKRLEESTDKKPLEVQNVSPPLTKKTADNIVVNDTPANYEALQKLIVGYSRPLPPNIPEELEKAVCSLIRTIQLDGKFELSSVLRKDGCSIRLKGSVVEKSGNMQQIENRVVAKILWNQADQSVGIGLSPLVVNQCPPGWSEDIINRETFYQWTHKIT